MPVVNIKLKTHLKSDTPFVKLDVGRHKAVLIETILENKAHLRKTNPRSTGACITWVFKTFGNPKEDQNDRKVYKATSIDGNVSPFMAIVYALDPNYKGEGEVDTDKFIGLKCELHLEAYNDRDGKECRFRNIKKVFPLIEGIDNFDTYLKDQFFTDTRYDIDDPNAPF